MRTRRSIAVTLALVAPIALAGCIALPPAIAPTPTPGVESPLPTEPAEPAPSPEPAPSSEAPDSPEPSPPAEPAEPAETPEPSDPGIATGSTITIDGQPAGAWSGTVRCTLVGEGGAFASTADDGTGSIFGNLAQADGAWLVSAALATDAGAFYVQSEPTAPATIAGDVLTVSLTASDFASGTTVTIAVTAPCARA